MSTLTIPARHAVPATVRSTNSTSTLIDQVVSIDEQIAALREARLLASLLLIARIGVGNGETGTIGRVTVSQGSEKDFSVAMAREILDDVAFEAVTKIEPSISGYNAAKKAGILPASFDDIVVTRQKAAYLNVTTF